MAIENRSQEPAASNSDRFRPAGFWIRSGAAFVDVLAVIGSLILLAPILRLINLLFSLSPHRSSGIEVAAVLILSPTIYHTIAIARFGKTYGTRFADIGVVRTDGGEVGFLRALVRAFGWLLEPCLLFMGCIIGAFTPFKRMLHDYVAGTRVVHLGNASAAQKKAMTFLGVCFPFAIVYVLWEMAIPKAEWLPASRLYTGMFLVMAIFWLMSHISRWRVS